MMLEKLISQFEALWPEADKEDWDKPGLMIGSPKQEISKVLLTVDVTREVLTEAVELGCQLVVSHHPMFLRAAHEFSDLGFKGANSSFAIRNNLAVFSAHTNADFQVDGVTQSLAKALGLEGLEPFSGANGHVVIGQIPQALTLLDFARSAAKRIPAVAQGLKVSGDPSRLISKVAVLAGAGDSYLSAVAHSGADLYITSDLRHHPAQDFSEQGKLGDGPALMDISHWAAEWVWLESAKAQLEKVNSQVEFVVSEINTDPWTFAVMQ
jgi:dinuclear metal center YbgI/SA1388 family protein